MPFEESGDLGFDKRCQPVLKAIHEELPAEAKVPNRVEWWPKVSHCGETLARHAMLVVSRLSGKQSALLRRAVEEETST